MASSMFSLRGSIRPIVAIRVSWLSILFTVFFSLKLVEIKEHSVKIFSIEVSVGDGDGLKT